MKRDPYKHEEQWLRWKNKNRDRILEISKKNSNLVLDYLKDMEMGINTSAVSKKGSRSFIRLNTLRNRIVFLIKKFEKKYKVTDISKLTEKQVCNFFAGMRSGEIKREDGKNYKSVRDYVKIFKAFWHWYQKVSRKKGEEIEDLTFYLDTSGTKPEWVYLDEKQVRQLCENASYEYKILIWFFPLLLKQQTQINQEQKESQYLLVFQ